MMRTTSLVSLLGLMLSIPDAATAQQWIEHRPDGGGYRVAFPAPPVDELNNVDSTAGPVTTRTSSVEFKDKVFVASSSTYPVDINAGDAQSSLDSARSGSVRNIDGKLMSEERLIVNNAPARRMVIDIPRSGQAANALIVL